MIRLKGRPSPEMSWCAPASARYGAYSQATDQFIALGAKGNLFAVLGDNPHLDRHNGGKRQRLMTETVPVPTRSGKRAANNVSSLLSQLIFVK